MISIKKIANSVNDVLDFVHRDMHGPEHNNYYDLLQAMQMCLEIMTPEQRRTFLLQWKKIQL